MSADMRERFVALQEFIDAARQSLDSNGWGYVVGGTETESTVLRNRLALESLALCPRVLNDVSSVQSGTEFLGRQLRLPIILAPVGGLETFDPDGGLTVARAAADFGVAMMLSSVSPYSMEEIIEQTSPQFPLIYQLYVRSGPDSVDAIVDRAEKLSLPAFCFTVDSAVYSRRERDIVARFSKPWRATGEGDARDWQAALSWSDIERVRARTKLPLILKGIATVADANRAVDAGVDVIYVSNHGGRQLDHGVGSVALLPEIADAVAGRSKVVVDGGICRGTDMVKALALGADAVGIGRMMCMALAAAGAPGLVRMLELLEEEFQLALALCGVTKAADLDRTFVRAGQPVVRQTSVLGAFPLIDQNL